MDFISSIKLDYDNTHYHFFVFTCYFYYHYRELTIIRKRSDQKEIFVVANLILVEFVCLETVTTFLSLVNYTLIAFSALNNNIFSVLF